MSVAPTNKDDEFQVFSASCCDYINSSTGDTE